MLDNSPVSAILPAADMQRAKNFYQNKLHLKLLPMPFDDPMMFEAGSGTNLAIYHKPEGTKAEHTVAGFNVTNIEKLILELESGGVIFEDYDTEQIKTVNHIVNFGTVKSAFFKDSEGNILALNQM